MLEIQCIISKVIFNGIDKHSPTILFGNVASSMLRIDPLSESIIPEDAHVCKTNTS
jgi:hypothetical protein